MAMTILMILVLSFAFLNMVIMLVIITIVPKKARQKRNKCGIEGEFAHAQNKHAKTGTSYSETGNEFNN